MISVEDAIAMYEDGYPFVVAKCNDDLETLEDVANILKKLGYPVYFDDSHRENFTAHRYLSRFVFIRD